ncbi:hypothetical protein [Qipengyuania qiaonensis]|uniref:Uncharacterized protein n=1 Tax=Qipengyuania qiaonensis TaxID=2867240 RepID=A0ABS7JA38_9SPHN|nr:hypothetical protein [Qipengyuania qiaonensis]MBX7482729.1 hypothetical protein [Qipengyuania qiaonensis]
MNNELYQTLAKALVAICPDGFDEARVDAELEGDWSQKGYYCKVGGIWSNGKSVPADLDFEVDDALHALRGMMRQEGREPWAKCSFLMKRDGSFTFDVSYPE